MTQVKERLFKGSIGASVEIKLDEVDDDGVFEGYGSVFGNMDRGRDIVQAGAFTKSLQTRPADKVKMLWQHRADMPIGVWTEMREDSKGLYCKGRILSDVKSGQEALSLMKAGAVDGLSIGYRVMSDDYDRDTRTRVIKEAELHEISVVTFPMNEAATVTGVKADELLCSPKLLERALRDHLGLSMKEAKVFMAKGYTALSQFREDAGKAAPRDAESTVLLDALKGLSDRIQAKS